MIKIIPVVIVILMTIPIALAHCPLCTLAAGAGVGIARAYGVDDSIVGLFLGALTVSSALWFNRWLRTKVELPLQKFLIIFGFFLMLVIPLYIANTITNVNIVKLSPKQSPLGYFGVDKLFFGIITGTIASWFAFSLSDYIKKRSGKVLWHYQGLSFMITILILLSLIFFMTIK